jgi:hypothetical protein
LADLPYRGRFARVVTGSTIVRALDTLNLRFPRVDKASLEEFRQVGQALLEEGRGGAKKVARIAKAASKSG